MADQKGEAMQLTPDNVTVVAIWCKGAIVEEIDPETNERYPALNVQCGEDVKRASLNDWVIKTEAGEFDVKQPGAYLRHLMEE